MYDKDNQPATTKQLWKLNDVAYEIFDLKLKKLEIDGESPKGKADHLSSNVPMPLNKKNAMELIEGMINLRDSLRELVDHLEQHGAPKDVHEMMGVSKS